MSRPTPRSIPEYLSALRAALDGEDPALIQDAVYDAEEHLRAEVAAHPGEPEADVLQRVVETYGRPEEIGAAYRDSEAKVNRALRPPPPRRPASENPLDRFFAVYSDPRAYTSLFFMLMSLITGVFYFSFAVTGLSLSIGLAILIIGLPMFLAFIGITRVIALGEGRLLEAVSGERMPRRPIHPDVHGGWWERIAAMLKDARTWTTLAYFVLMLPVGSFYFSAAVTGLSVGLAFLLVPVVGFSQRMEWGADWRTEPLRFHPLWLDTPIGWVFCAVVGVVVLTTLLHVARGVIKLHARAAKALLVT